MITINNKQYNIPDNILEQYEVKKSRWQQAFEVVQPRWFLSNIGDISGPCIDNMDCPESNKANLPTEADAISQLAAAQLINIARWKNGGEFVPDGTTEYFGIWYDLLEDKLRVGTYRQTLVFCPFRNKADAIESMEQDKELWLQYWKKEGVK